MPRSDPQCHGSEIEKEADQERGDEEKAVRCEHVRWRLTSESSSENGLEQHTAAGKRLGWEAATQNRTNSFALYRPQDVINFWGLIFSFFWLLSTVRRAL